MCTTPFVAASAATSTQPLEEFVKTHVNKNPSVFKDDSSFKR
jgi:hypothetical protein